jgi:hypothetical protein
VKKKIANKLAQSKRKIQKRLAKKSFPDKPGPMLNPGNIHYDIDRRSGGILFGGIGAIQMLVKKLEPVYPAG